MIKADIKHMSPSFIILLLTEKRKKKKNQNTWAIKIEKSEIFVQYICFIVSARMESFYF